MNPPVTAGVNSDAHLIAMFLSSRKRKSINTAYVYSGVLNEFFALLGNKSIRTITYSDLVDYSEYLAAPDYDRNPATLAVSTQNRKIATIKSLFSYAKKIGYVTFNPAEPLETKRVDSKIAQRILMETELESIVVAAQETGKLALLIVMFFACTGCRVSELANAMWRSIFIAPQGERCITITGKGNKDRLIKIPDLLWNTILDYREDKGLLCEIDGQSYSPLIVNKFGNNMSSQFIWKIIKDVTTRAGVKKNVSPHWLRHTFATEVAKNKDSNLWQLQNDLGHSSIRTTEGYVHIAQGMAETSVDHLNYLTTLEKHITKRDI